MHPARSGLRPRGENGQASFALLSPSPSRSPRNRCGSGPIAVKSARTSVVAETTGAQAPPPSHAPCQPANRDPGAAFGLRVTFVPTGNDCSQSPGQLIPAGSLETSPPPSTVTRRFAVFEGGGGGGGPPGRSTVQRCVSRAVYVVPARSLFVAVTRKTWTPSPRPEYVFGELQAAARAPSSEHVNSAVSFATQPNVADAEAEVLGGALVILTVRAALASAPVVSPTASSTIAAATILNPRARVIHYPAST